jgi:hypothetical protein
LAANLLEKGAAAVKNCFVCVGVKGEDLLFSVSGKGPLPLYLAAE